MNVISSRQAALLRLQIRRLYKTNFITVHSQDTNISIGDIMSSRNNETVVLDGKQIPEEYTRTTVGKKLSRNIVTGNLNSFSTKITGEFVGTYKLGEEETGINLGFSGESQMALLLRSTTRTRLANFIEFKRYVLSRYTEEDLSARAFIVDEVLEAEQFFLQFGGTKGGELGVVFDLPVTKYSPALSAQAKILHTYQKNTGFSIDGREGGVLAYRVSKIKLLRERLKSKFIEKLIDRYDEPDLLDSLSKADRTAIAKDEGFDMVDKTADLIIDHEQMLEV